MERSETNQTAGTSDTQRLEKKQQQLVDVENEYLKLNPWYNQQKEKPVFGLGQPLPHTMRRGMWWGKSDLKKRMEDLKAEEEDLQKGIDARDGLDIAKEKGECLTHVAFDSYHNVCSFLTKFNRIWGGFRGLTNPSEARAVFTAIELRLPVLQSRPYAKYAPTNIRYSFHGRQTAQ